MSTEATSSQARTVLLTALITAATTLGVETLRGCGQPKISPPPSWRIEGKVKSLTTLDSTVARLSLTKADDSRHAGIDGQGKFVFDRVPMGHYWIEVDAGAAQGMGPQRYLIEAARTSAAELTPPDGSLTIHYTTCADGDAGCR